MRRILLLSSSIEPERVLQLMDSIIDTVVYVQDMSSGCDEMIFIRLAKHTPRKVHHKIYLPDKVDITKSNG